MTPSCSSSTPSPGAADLLDDHPSDVTSSFESDHEGSDSDSDVDSTTSSDSFYSLSHNLSSASSIDIPFDDTLPQVRNEYNRTYHTFHPWRWPLPNDEQEQDRLQITDQMRNLQLNGELHFAPIHNPARILDVGTGTGNWACQMAFKFPNSRVVGIDLSPIQVSPPPDNVRWEIGDADERWTFPPNYFSFVHTAGLVGGISDWRKFFQRAFRALQPAGWIELKEVPFVWYTDNPGTVLEELPVVQSCTLFSKAMKLLGYDVADVVGEFKALLEEAGFVDVEETVIRNPLGPWMENPTDKQIGLYHMLSILEAVEGHLIAPLHRALGMDPHDIIALAELAKKDIRSKRHRLYSNLHIIRARKPTACEVLAATVRPGSSSSSEGSSDAQAPQTAT